MNIKWKANITPAESAGPAYYFCWQHCADGFAADPSKYAAPARTK